MRDIGRHKQRGWLGQRSVKLKMHDGGTHAITAAQQHEQMPSAQRKHAALGRVAEVIGRSPPDLSQMCLGWPAWRAAEPRSEHGPVIRARTAPREAGPRWRMLPPDERSWGVGTAA